MEYNTSGQRTKRISDEKSYTYIYADDKLVRMTVGDDVLDFCYDANGAPLTMTYNGTVYYYITNLQGDVTSLEQADGGVGAQYAYDAWGNIIAITGTLAELNPLRYRGYVYDQETGFYYLNSRYYDPAIGRFINSDDPDYLGGNYSLISYNAFTYCLNNPVNHFDSDGNLTLSNWAKVTIGVAATITALAVTVATGGAALPVLAGVALSTAGGAVTGYITGGKQGAIDGAADGFMFGGLSALAVSAIGAIKTVNAYRKSIDTYSSITKQYKGTGMEAHHIIERRLALGSKWNVNKMPSVELTKSAHQVYTQAWRKAVSYGTSYSPTLTYKYTLYRAANSVYQTVEYYVWPQDILFSRCDF